MPTMWKHKDILIPPSGHHPPKHTLHTNSQPDYSDNCPELVPHLPSSSSYHRHIKTVIILRYSLTTSAKVNLVPHWSVILLSACKQLRISHLTHYSRAINPNNIPQQCLQVYDIQRLPPTLTHHKSPEYHLHHHQRRSRRCLSLRHIILPTLHEASSPRRLPNRTTTFDFSSVTPTFLMA